MPASARTANTLSDEERLQRFESLTDAALAYLGTEDLLTELLGRLRGTLEVDAAAVLIMDESRSHLVPSLKRGPPDSPEGGILPETLRIPVGEGFVGRIARDRKATAFSPADDPTDPVVEGSGLAALLGVPLVSGGTVLGVLYVGSRTDRPFTEDDVDLLQSAGDRMALALQARSADAQLSAAIMLQRSLVPSRMPPIAGLDTAARYVPGGGGAVGGDWYDVFTLPTGHVGFAVGDVVGHGLQAAVVMGRLRSALRAYALGSLDPAEVLTQLNRKLRHFERYQMATLLYGVLDPLLDRVHLSSAGHPPAILTMPDGDAALLDVPPDLPLGVSLGAPRRTTTVDLPEAGLLCAYTDGLIERRGESLDDGLDRLRRTVDLCRPAGVCEPEKLCDALMAELLGREQPRDDVALLVIQREVVQERNVLVVPAERTALTRIRIALRRWLAPTGADDVAVDDILVAVSEAAANSIEHAYGPAGGLLEVSLQVSGDQAVAIVRDNGSWRPPRGRGRGRGIQLMQGLSDEVRVDSATTGTEVTIRRRLREEEDGP